LPHCSQRSTHLYITWTPEYLVVEQFVTSGQLLKSC
jgi:hypothetical protein